MIDFIKKYRLILFFLLPLWIVSGNVAPNIVTFGIVTFCLIYFAFIKRSDYTLISFLIILIFADSDIPYLAFSISLKVVVMIAITAVSIWDIRRGLYHINRSFFAFVPFLFLALVSTNWSPIQGQSLSKTLSYGMLWFSGFHIIRYLFYNYGGIFLRDVTHLATLVLLSGLILMVVNPSLVFFGGPRYSGIFRNPNGMGVFITLLTPLYVYYFREQGNVSMFTKVFSYFLLIVSLILCASRNSLLCFLLFHNGLYAMKGNLLRRIFFMGGVIPFTFILISNISIYDVSQMLGTDKYLRVTELASGSGRVMAWEEGLNFASDKLLLGCGFACEEWFFIQSTPYELWLSGHQGGVHNSYIAFLINVGVLGCIAFAYFLFSVIRQISNYGFLLPYLITIFLSATFESWLAASLNAFTIFFVIMLMVLTVGEKTKLFPIE